MYEMMMDQDGNMMVFEFEDDDDYRNARANPRQSARRRSSVPARRRSPRVTRVTRYSPPQPQHYPQPVYPGQMQMQPYPYQQQGLSGIDMRTGMKALGALLPGLGQLLSAFRRTPERPQLTGQGEEDLAALLDYIADVFTHDRSGEQMTAVLATTGAMLEILGSL